MPAAGDIIYASDVTRARPKYFWDSATAVLVAGSSVADIPGISISFTAETAGATAALFWTIDADPGPSGTPAVSLISARPRITDPSSATSDAPVFADYESNSASANDRATVSNNWLTTLGSAGTYTVTLKGNTSTNQQINLYTTLMVIVQEQFS